MVPSCRPVNGTTGYEEAAGQGAIAGINAAPCPGSRAPCPGRNQAFLARPPTISSPEWTSRTGFTSRSEFRLLLRQDNALRRGSRR